MLRSFLILTSTKSNCWRGKGWATRFSRHKCDEWRSKPSLSLLQLQQSDMDKVYSKSHTGGNQALPPDAEARVILVRCQSPDRILDSNLMLTTAGSEKRGFLCWAYFWISIRRALFPVMRHHESSCQFSMCPPDSCCTLLFGLRFWFRSLSHYRVSSFWLQEKWHHFLWRPWVTFTHHYE